MELHPLNIYPDIRNAEYVLSSLNSESTEEHTTGDHFVSLSDKIKELRIQSELVVWLTGSDSNTTLQSPYGRRFIKDLLEMVADSDTVLVLQGSNAFFKHVKSPFNNHKLMEIRKKVNVLVCQNKLATYSPKTHRRPATMATEMFQCAFVFEGRDVDYNSVIKNLPQRMPVTVIKEMGEKIRGTHDLDLEKEYTNKGFSVAKLIFRDFKSFMQTEHQSGIITYSPCSVDQNLFLLCIYLNQFDQVPKTGFQELSRPENNLRDMQWLENAAFLAMRLYRQNFLTYMSQQGVNLIALVNEHFICTLFQKEPWQDTNNPYHEGLTLVGICRDVFKKIRPLAGKSFLEKTEESFDMADLLFVDSVFEMKLETSLLYWTLVRHPIHAALIAYGISKNLKKSSQGKAKVLKENMTTYRKLLIEAVNNSYYKSRPETFKMLKQQIPEWGSASCIQIALATSNKKFLSEAPLVNMRECIWNGQKLEGNNYSKTGTIKEIVQRKLRAPVTKFTYNLVFYIIFLGFYGILLLSQLESGTYHWLEWLLVAWIGIFILQLILSWITGGFRIDDVFCILDIFSMLFYLLAFGLRVAAKEWPDNKDLMEPARVFYSLDYILFALRLLKYCYGSEFLGPLIAMIIGMTSTLTKFLVILLICFLAYVVSSEAVLNPNSEINWKLLYFVSRKAFWSMFGDYHLDEIENQDTSNETCTNDPQLYNSYLQPRCPSEVGRYFVPIVLGVFIVLVNLMLFNLIIAKFNSIITDIELRSRHIWNHQMFQLVIEYDQALILQPPLFFLPIILYIINCKQCFNNQVSAAPPECDVVFEKDVVLYLKQQIDDGRFFKRLDTYKRSGKQNLDMLLSTFQDTTDELNRVIADEQRQRGVVERWQTESKTELDEMQRKIAQIQDMIQKSSRNMDTLLAAKNLNTGKSLSVSELEKTQNAIRDLQLSVDSSTNQSRQQDQRLSDQLTQIKDQIRTSEMKMEDNQIKFEKILQATNDVGMEVEDLKEKQAKKDGELEMLNKNVRTLKARQKKNDKDLLEKLVVLQEEKPGKEHIDRMIQERSEKTEKMLTTLTGLTRRILNKERYEGGES